MSNSEHFDLIWHIDRAQFSFENPADYENWKRGKKVFFSLELHNADDFGRSVFANPHDAEINFEITDDKGDVRISLGSEGPQVSVWVKIKAKLVEGLSEDALDVWAAEQGGWFSGTIHLGPYEVHITEDDGGDWRFPFSG